MSYDVLDRGWPDRIFAPLAADRACVRVVSPFIKRRQAVRLLEHGPVDDLRVVTRFALEDFASGVSDLEALRFLTDHGGRVRGLRGLHAKLYLPTTSSALVTSANLTGAGMAHNRELGVASSDPKFVEACAAYFESLWEAAGPDVEPDQLAEWAAMVHAVWRRGGPPGLVRRLPDFGATTTLAPASPPGVPSPVGIPSPFEESDRAWIKFFGEGRNRAPHSTLVIDEVRRTGCHWSCTYPSTRRPRSVRDGDTMFLSRLVKQPKDIVIFGRAIATAYRPGHDDATAEDIERRPWREQWSRYIRVHHAEFIDGPLGGGVSLAAMMDELGPDSFRTTQEHRGTTGNTNPRKAFQQQPAVQLSPEGHEWIGRRLQLALAAHGSPAPAAMETLDWPRADLDVPSAPDAAAGTASA